MKCPNCYKEINIIREFLVDKKEELACPDCHQKLKFSNVNFVVYAPMPLIWLVFVLLDIVGNIFEIDHKGYWPMTSISVGVIIGICIYIFAWKKILQLKKSIHN